MEFYANAVKLRYAITTLLLRDFGIKDKVRNIDYFAKCEHMTEGDTKTLISLMDKYNIHRITDEYPLWLVDRFRSSLMEICRSLVMNITAANTIYPMSEPEYYDRRHLQTAAICDCQKLLQEMQYIISIVPVNAEKYMPYVEMIDFEIALLTGWRKSDNRLLKGIRAKAAAC